MTGLVYPELGVTFCQAVYLALIVHHQRISVALGDLYSFIVTDTARLEIAKRGRA